MFPQSVGRGPSPYPTKAHRPEAPLLEQVKTPAPSNPGGWVLVVRIPNDRVMALEEVVQSDDAEALLGREFAVDVQGGLTPGDILGAIRVYPDGNQFRLPIRNPNAAPPPTPPG
jgi:hypothetical protein